MCGDLTSAFDFVNPNGETFPKLPDVSGSAATIAAITRNFLRRLRPKSPEKLFQEPGLRRSRALPYELHVRARVEPAEPKLVLTFRNSGDAGAVFHVYDKLHLDRIPRRYTVEPAKILEDDWLPHPDHGHYDLWVYGPNGFVREFRGSLKANMRARFRRLISNTTRANRSVRLVITNDGHAESGALHSRQCLFHIRARGRSVFRAVAGLFVSGP